ncbi:MAG: acetyl-CoA synthase subunit gamma [Deltaproteobacteria bacterium]|nr:acetyl-CoA synthase subunit gamma [Deltaproteobacteria bacterium]
MGYVVDPGLYALGQPNKKSPILVTANYKLSFDKLRERLTGRDFWILVVDTKGVNVWCAAGKGSFGTEELVRRIAAARLTEVVNHRTIILPQLAGPGVAAHLVKQLSGFNVRYGPIRAADLIEYLDAGMKASPSMREESFSLAERIVLVPVELVAALKAAFFIIVALFFTAGLGAEGHYWQSTLAKGPAAAAAIGLALLAGTVAVPVLLPCIPGRAFTAKGILVGLAASFLFLVLTGTFNEQAMNILEKSAWILIITAATAYLAMNFTGASTFTSLSGVKKEMRWGLPVEIAGAVAGIVLLIASRLAF